MSRSLKTKEKTWKAWMIPTAKTSGSVRWEMPKKDAKEVYLGYLKGKEEIDWKPNKPFQAALKFKEMFYEARDRTHAVFINTENNAEYILRDEDLAYCLTKGVFVFGVILGTWRFSCLSNRCSVVPYELTDKRKEG